MFLSRTTRKASGTFSIECGNLPSPSAPKQRELPVHQVVAGIDHEAKRKQFAEQQSRAAEQRRRERVEGIFSDRPDLPAVAFCDFGTGAGKDGSSIL